jgi:hypothetical protein
VTRQLAFFINLGSVFLVSGASLFSQTTHVSVVPDSVKSGTFEASKGSGKVPLESRALQARIELPSHNTAILDVLMLYDPGTKLFWWQADPVPAVRHDLDFSKLLPPNSVICITDSKFVTFWNGWISADQILVRESAEHYSSLDEGQAHVLAALENSRGDIDSGKFIHEYKKVKFGRPDRDFLFAKNVENLVGPTLRDVRRVGNEWQIIEDGPNGGSALIVLSDQYEVVKTTILPSK